MALKVKTNKTKSTLDFLNARLDEVRMSIDERQRAKAILARTEAVADAMLEFINLVKQLLKTLVVRPFRRLITSVG
jgi:hypothetical protein